MELPFAGFYPESKIDTWVQFTWKVKWHVAVVLLVLYNKRFFLLSREVAASLGSHDICFKKLSCDLKFKHVHSQALIAMKSAFTCSYLHCYWILNVISLRVFPVLTPWQLLRLTSNDTHCHLINNLLFWLLQTATFRIWNENISWWTHNSVCIVHLPTRIMSIMC